MSAIAQHAAPHSTDDPRTRHALAHTAKLSTDPQTLDDLARPGMPFDVLQKIAHNPATSADTLERLIELDERWLTYPVTRRGDLAPERIDRIARRLTDRSAIFHASSARNAAPETLRYLAAHPSAPAATQETVARRLGEEPVAAA